MPETPLEQVKKHFKELKQSRRGWEVGWAEYKKFIAPSRGRFLGSVSASEVNQGDSVLSDQRINGVASRALSVLASGIQSGLTSKARQWFQLAHPDPEVNSYKDVREWYDTVQDVLNGVFQRSNVYSALLHTYFEMAGFGTGAMMVLEENPPCRTSSAFTSLRRISEVSVFPLSMRTPFFPMLASASREIPLASPFSAICSACRRLSISSGDLMARSGQNSSLRQVKLMRSPMVPTFSGMRRRDAWEARTSE